MTNFAQFFFFFVFFAVNAPATPALFFSSVIPEEDAPTSSSSPRRRGAGCGEATAHDSRVSVDEQHRQQQLSPGGSGGGNGTVNPSFVDVDAPVVEADG